jgi:hypothetical protein
MKKTNKSPHYFRDIIALLEELHKYYPSENLGWHISLATSDYPDLCVVPDRELLFAFQKYQAERELDVNNLASDDYVKDIEDDAQHLFDKHSPEDEWEEDEY